MRLPQQSCRLHFVMQCDGVPVVSIRPSQSAVFQKDPPEIFGIFQWGDHRPGSLKQRFKIPRANGPVGKFHFKLEATESANADYFNHHQGLRSVPAGYQSSPHANCASAHHDAALSILSTVAQLWAVTFRQSRTRPLVPRVEMWRFMIIEEHANRNSQKISNCRQPLPP